jgi:hypothetical protein
MLLMYISRVELFLLHECLAPIADFTSDLSNQSHGVHINEDHLTSQLFIKGYTDHHGGKKQDNPHGVAPNAVPSILPDVDNHRQTHGMFHRGILSGLIIVFEIPHHFV